jgi:hypothetical protein
MAEKTLRERAIEMLAAEGGEGKGWTHVYASFNRPLSVSWVRLPIPFELVHDPQGANRRESRPWTWLVSSFPLTPAEMNAYELRMAIMPDMEEPV